MFTSRLPISTSVRRPNPADNITRPSNIPVTVRKINLFTPQTKRGTLTGATSTAGKSFTSGPTTEKKFQRSVKPAPDRDAQTKMFDTLTDFLKNNAPGFPCPEAKKFFSSVSTTESTRIFDLLLSRILPDFKISRLEIDVPEALAQLGYPYIRSVTKSSLVSITTRQAAAGLLLIFCWLIDFIQMMEDEELDDDPRDENGLVLINMIMNPDNVQEENQRAIENLYPREDLNSLEQELENVRAERDNLRCRQEEIDALKQDRATIDEDMITCQNYYSQMQKYLQTKQNELEDAKLLRPRRLLQIEDQLKQKERLFHYINSHELDINALKREQINLDKLKQTHKTFSDQLVQLEIERQEQLNKRQRLLERYDDLKKENINLMKDLLELYESEPAMETSTLAERKSELRDWILRFENLGCDDLISNQKAEEDLRLFYQKLGDTDSRLQAELSTYLNDRKSDQKQLELAESKYREVILPRIQAAIEKTEREIESSKQHYRDSLSRLRHHGEDEVNRLSRMLQELSANVLQLREQLDRELQRLKKDGEEANRLIDLGMTHLKSVLDRNKQKALNIMKETKQEVEIWRERLAVMEHNDNVVRKAYKMLEKPLNLSG